MKKADQVAAKVNSPFKTRWVNDRSWVEIFGYLMGGFVLLPLAFFAGLQWYIIKYKVKYEVKSE